MRKARSEINCKRQKENKMNQRTMQEMIQWQKLWWMTHIARKKVTDEAKSWFVFSV